MTNPAPAKGTLAYQKWRANIAKWAVKNPGKVKTSYQKWRLRRYDISSAEFDKMLLEQAGNCGICGDKMLRICIDHCHAAGGVRGLLCNSCNFGLGHFKDSPKRLLLAIKYLETKLKQTFD